MKTLEEKIEVMQAALAGKEIEYFGSTKNWITATCPCWDWEDFDYRVKPVNKQVPYDFSDAENLIGRKCREKSSKSLGIIIWVNDYGVYFGEVNYNYQALSEYFEIWNNTLNRWESCTKTVKG
jgi:hypothetical protein